MKNKEQKKFETSIRVIAIPIILMGIVNAAMTAVDQFMMGFYNENDVAAVYMGGQYRMIAGLLLPMVSGGAAVYMNQLFGAGRRSESNEYSTINLILSSTFGVLLFLFFAIFPDITLEFLNVNDTIYEGAKIYMTITAFYLLIDGVTQWVVTHLSMIARTKHLLIVVIVYQISNISLNYLLIFGNFGFPELGIKGSAYATMISAYVAMAYLLIAILGIEKVKVAKVKMGMVFQKGWKIIKLGSYKSIEPSTWMLTTFITVAAIGKLGDNPTKAFSYASLFFPFSVAAAGGISRASAIICGYYAGIKDEKGIIHTINKSLLWSGGISTVASLTLALVIVPVTSIFTNDEEILRTVQIMAYINIGAEIVRILNMICVHSLGALGDIRWIAFKSPIVMIIMLAIVPTIIANTYEGTDMVTKGLYLIMFCRVGDELIRGAIVYYRFKSKKWKKYLYRKDKVII